MKFLFYFVFVEHFSKCKSRQQKQGDTEGKSHLSTITGFLTGTKRKESAGPSEQETQRKKAKNQKHSEGYNPIDPDFDDSDCEK